MQLIVIIGTLLISTTIAIMVIKHTQISAELVHHYYLKEKKRFSEEIIIYTTIAEFFENSQLRQQLFTYGFYKTEAMFYKIEKNEVLLYKKNILVCSLVPVNSFKKEQCTQWILEMK